MKDDELDVVVQLHGRWDHRL